MKLVTTEGRLQARASSTPQLVTEGGRLYAHTPQGIGAVAYWRLWFGPSGSEAKLQVDGLTSLVGGKRPDKVAKQMAAGFRHPHGQGWAAGVSRVYISTRWGTGTSPSGGKYRLLRIDPDDLDNITYYEGGANDIWGDGLAIIGSKVYVVRADFATQTKVYVDVFDTANSPPTLESTQDLGTFGSGSCYGNCITTDGTYLFIGTVNGYLLRVDPSTWTVTHNVELLASAMIHSARYDSQNSHVFATTGSGYVMLYRVDAADLGNQTSKRFDNAGVMGALTDDMAVATDYIYLGLEGAGVTGEILKVKKSDLTWTRIQAGRAGQNCYGVFEDWSGDYVWAVFVASPGEITRVKVSDDSLQRLWLASGETPPNEIVFCGSDDKFIVTTYENPMKVLTLTVGEEEVMRKGEGPFYSYWWPLRLFVETVANVDDIEVYTDGVNSLGTGVDLNGNDAPNYTQPAGEPGVGGDVLNTTNYPSLTGAPVDVFGWVTGSRKSVGGSGSGPGDVGNFVVLQMVFGAAAAMAQTPTEVVTLAHTDGGVSVEKVATVYGDLGKPTLTPSPVVAIGGIPVPTVEGGAPPGGHLGLRRCGGIPGMVHTGRGTW